MATNKKTTSTAVATVTAPSNLPAIPTDKPMNQTQLNNLKKLIQVDFDNLTAQLDVELNQKLAKRIKSIEAKYAKEVGRVDVARNEVALFQERVRQEAKKLKEKFIKDGVLRAGFGDDGWEVVYTPPQGNAYRYLAVQGRDEEVSRVQHAYQRLWGIAKNMIDQEKRKYDRLVLLQGITAGPAAELLAAVPTVDVLISNIAEQIQKFTADDADLADLLD